MSKIQLFFKTLSFISAKSASQLAFKIFQKVRKKDIRDREKDFFKNGSVTNIKFGNEDLKCIQYGQEYNDVILLVHGWDSNAGCMSAISEMLLKKQKHVISFNLPGHADYIKSHTNLMECQLAFQTVLNKIPTTKTLSIISHSFGSAVTAYGLSKTNRPVDQLFFLTSPDRIIDIFSDFKSLIALGDKSYNLLLKKAEQIIKEKVENIEISHVLEDCNFNQLFIFHDKNDKVIPFSNSKRIHATSKKSQLFEYENIGHYRMLWNKNLISDLSKIF